MLKRLLAPALCFFALSGCLSQLQPTSMAPRAEPVSYRSYRIGEYREVAVGQAMVQVRQYRQTIADYTAMKANEDISIIWRGLLGDSPLLVVVKGQELPVLGQRYIDGRRHFIVNLPDGSGRLLQIDELGKLYQKINAPVSGFLYPAGSTVEVIGTLEIMPPSASFSPVGRASWSRRTDDEYYEVVFLGVDAGSIRLQYREYSPGAPDRPSLVQDLTFPRQSRSIRVKNLGFAIQQVAADNLLFAVIEDGRG